jgi:hypothetical protein
MDKTMDTSNKLTWKCRLFGCRDEVSYFYYEKEEKHGITGGFSFATVATTITEISYEGCYWCSNYRKVIGETDTIFPAWFCNCDICTAANQHRPWLYE